MGGYVCMPLFAVVVVKIGTPPFIQQFLLWNISQGDMGLLFSYEFMASSVGIWPLEAMIRIQHWNHLLHTHQHFNPPISGTWLCSCVSHVTHARSPSLKNAFWGKMHGITASRHITEPKNTCFGALWSHTRSWSGIFSPTHSFLGSKIIHFWRPTVPQNWMPRFYQASCWVCYYTDSCMGKCLMHPFLFKKTSLYVLKFPNLGT